MWKVGKKDAKWLSAAFVVFADLGHVSGQLLLSGHSGEDLPSRMISCYVERRKERREMAERDVL